MMTILHIFFTQLFHSMAFYVLELCLHLAIYEDAIL